MIRLPSAPLLLASAALLGGCFDLSNPSTGSARLSPILDSMFVDDTLSARTLTYLDPDGIPQNPGVIKWHITVDSVGGVPAPVATIDSVTGEIVGKRRGTAVVYAAAAPPRTTTVTRPRAGWRSASSTRSDRAPLPCSSDS